MSSESATGLFKAAMKRGARTALAAALIVGGCPAGDAGNPREGQGAQNELDRNRAKWASKGIEDYRFKFRWQCYCPRDYTRAVFVRVRGGEIEAVEYADGGGPVDVSQISRYRTIYGLFGLLQEAIDRKAHSVSVEYDGEFGYPTSAAIDYSEQIADEEQGFQASDLLPIR